MSHEDWRKNEIVYINVPITKIISKSYLMVMIKKKSMNFFKMKL